MHPLKQRREVLGALMVCSQMAREEFARRVNLVIPDKQVRFQVRTAGNAYHIVDLVTGKTKAFRWIYKAAVDMASQFEAQAARLAGGAR